MPWVLLFDRETGRQFYVFGYHMPCVFQRPPVMSLQLEAVMRKIAELTRKTPFILAGDFNFQPDSALYEFATTARCPEAIRPYPAFSLWSSSCRQGLVDHLGKKSKLVTNKTPGFQGRIDYIWTSANWRLVRFTVRSSERKYSSGPWFRPCAVELLFRNKNRRKIGLLTLGFQSGK